MQKMQGTWLHISLVDQTLRLKRGADTVKSWPIASGKAGAGEQKGSGATPRGWHQIRLAIGENAPRGAVFVARRWTGEVHSAALQAQFPDRDWILSRILWLTGLEPGRNRGGSVDTLSRYIYIHGCPDGSVLGEPISHGCIRLANDAVMALFQEVNAGTKVLIEEDGI